MEKTQILVLKQNSIALDLGNLKLEEKLTHGVKNIETEIFMNSLGLYAVDKIKSKQSQAYIDPIMVQVMNLEMELSKSADEDVVEF